MVGKEVVIDMRLEPENSSGNSVVELTAKENVWGKKKKKTRDDQTLPKQPSDPRSLVPAVPSLFPKKALVAQSKQDRGLSGFFSSLLTL